jgi:hypothetical protein
MFIANMLEKMSDDEFRNDIFTILRPEIEYDNDLAYKKVTEKLINII